MDSEVTGSKGKRRRLWVAGGVGAVLVVGVLAGLVANGSRSGSASDIVQFTCSGQRFWFNKTEQKKYGDIENKQDKLVTADFLREKCNWDKHYGQEFYKFLKWTFNGYVEFWVLDDKGRMCIFQPGPEYETSFFMSYCYAASKLDEYYVLRKD